MARSLKISVASGDAFEFDADVLVLKYAQSLYGADRAAFGRLSGIGIKLDLPKPADFAFQKSLGSMNPRSVLFVGVKPLLEFAYPEIRDFSRNALTFLSQKAPHIRSLALTIHGPGYGLDEVEAFQSELAGVIEAVADGHFPSALESIAFVEFDTRRARRLTHSLKELLPNGAIPIDGADAITGLEDQAQHTLRTAGYASSSKSHVFVASHLHRRWTMFFITAFKELSMQQACFVSEQIFLHLRATF